MKLSAAFGSIVILLVAVLLLSRFRDGAGVDREGLLVSSASSEVPVGEASMVELSPAPEVLVSPARHAMASSQEPEPASSALAGEPALRASLQVTIIGAHGPARGVQVTLRARGGSMNSETTDARGLCHFEDLEPGREWSLSAFDPGFLRRRLFKPLPLEPGEVRQLTFPLCESSTLRGRLVDEFGAHVANHDVRLRWGKSQELQRRGAGGESEQVSAMEIKQQEVYRSARTNERGEFEFEFVAPGTWWAWPVADDDPAVSTPLALGVALVHDLEAPGVRHSLVLQTGRSIHGTVTFHDGKPAAGASVRVTAVGSLRWWRTAQCDEHGQFEVEGLPEGEYWLRAKRRSPDPKYAPMTHPPDAESDNIYWGSLHSSRVRVFAGSQGNALLLDEVPQRVELLSVNLCDY